MNKKKIIFFLCVIIVLLILFNVINKTNVNSNIKETNEINLDTENKSEFEIGDEYVEINLFYMVGCSACAQMKNYLNDIKDEYNIVINEYEVYSNTALFKKYIEDYQVPKDKQGAVPTLFIEDNYFVGYSTTIANNIENIIINKLKNENIEIEEPTENEEKTEINTKILGLFSVNVLLNNKSLFLVTLILAILDSLNICSITVLIFLIIYMLSIGSFKKTLKIGLIFITIIYLFYFLFMMMLTSVLNIFILKYGMIVRVVLFFIAVIVGLILVKDFIYYGKGISLGIPKFMKPTLEKYLKKATIISTIIFALLASLVELPCTAIFPLIYSTILAENGIVSIAKISWIAFYNLIYIIPLLLIVLGVYLSWIRIEHIDKNVQKYKKWMKLIAGIMLILVAIYLILPFF